MQIRIVTILTLFFGLLAGGGAASAEQYELTFSNGSSWRGDDGARVDVVFNEQGIEQSIQGVVKKIDGRPGFQIVF
ncbi:MAG: hypothetical protein QMB94_11410, partial [Phycisphaerales bacterium]